MQCHSCSKQRHAITLFQRSNILRKFKAAYFQPHIFACLIPYNPHLCSKIPNPTGDLYMYKQDSRGGPKLTKHKLTIEPPWMDGLPGKRAQHQQICTLHALPLSDIMSECGVLYLNAFSSAHSLSSFSRHTDQFIRAQSQEVSIPTLRFTAKPQRF